MRIGAPVNVQRNIACVALDWSLVVGDVLMIRLFTELGSLRIGHVDRDGSISTGNQERDTQRPRSRCRVAQRSRN